MKSLEINGADNVGKSKQIELLRAGGFKTLNFMGSINNYSSRWPKLGPVEEFNWWFREVGFDDLVSIIIESIVNRRKAEKDGFVNISDRGTPLFKAVCAATLMIRTDVDWQNAVDCVDGLFQTTSADEEGTTQMLLSADAGYFARVQGLRAFVERRESRYEAWQNALYAQYQANFSNLIPHYLPANSVTGVDVDDCIIGVQNKLRRVVGGLIGTDLPVVCGSLKRIAAFGGLSECGKSSFAEELRLRHGFCRLKLKFFGQNLLAKGLQPTSSNLGQELVSFIEAHPYIDKMSIESLHGVELAAYLKLLFGDLLRTIYIDTPEAVRVDRASKDLACDLLTAREAVAAKDSVKKSKGADKIASIADIVFPNGHSDFDSNFLRFSAML